ncbi:NADPH-dependent FMN reductase [Microbacterium gorillae]|uniref:NADPH-dependent FMN reductase n=1 Tax=Microbacterium gorillae TaxID=1231063 RepID=UPI00058FDC27|nr:NAD(P)H-dependent oxidoreductase [Microbacterium gorillae]
MKIGIISGSIRQGRNSAHVARWVKDHADALASDGVEFELVALADYDLPLFDGAVLPAMMNKQYDNPAVAAWSEKIDSFDAYVFVTPEYNHGVPGALKNAVDSLGPEWTDKVVAFVSYGADGGVRAVEQWRQILANFNIYAIRSTVALALFQEFGHEGFAPLERRAQEIEAVLTSLIQTTERVGVPASL